MADILTPTTELDAINVLLGTIGITPVNTLEDDDNATADVVTARNVLRRVCREVQTKGWHFNTEENYPLTRNLEGKIKLPANIVRVDLNNCRYYGLDVVQRGQFLYDKISHGYVFKQDVKATVVLLLPFDEMPEAARLYCTVVAARKFQDDVMGDEVRHKFTDEDELRARVSFLNAEADTADYSYANNYDVAAIIER